jgi:hypothetical protein
LSAVRLTSLLLVAALLPAGALAQSPERNAVELRQGMTPEEVQKLLGKPRRTALRADGGYAGSPTQGTLQWTYVWGASNAASSERVLQVDFAGKGAGQWSVNGWGWPGH